MIINIAIWLAVGLIAATIVHPYELKLYNRLYGRYESMDIAFFIFVVLCGPASFIVGVIFIIWMFLRRHIIGGFNFIKKLNNFWNLPN